MIWLRCFEKYLTTEGLFDERGSGDLVIVNAAHVAVIMPVIPNVSLVRLATTNYVFYTQGDPEGVLARINANGSASVPKVAA